MTAASREDWTHISAVRKTRASRNFEGTGGRIQNLPVLGYGHSASLPERRLPLQKGSDVPDVNFRTVVKRSHSNMNREHWTRP